MSRILPVSFAALVLTWMVGQAAAQTVTVTTASDTVDIDWQNATIADLPGPDGRVSFSEAMIATNNTPGHQTVGFAIPQNEWTLQFALPGRAVLTSTTGFFFRAFDSVTIDGTTQTAFTDDTNPNGNEVAIYGAELYLNADDCTVIGLDSSPITITGSNGIVRGNTGTMNITLYSGSGSLVEGNTGGTIKIDRSNDNVVIGNTVSRVRVLGFVSEFGTGPAMNNRIGGPTLAERNYITGYGTWDGEGFPGGTTVQIFDSTGTLVENNWIGTTPDGLEQGSLASTAGIGFEGENHDTIIRNNRIAGILGHGIGPHADGLLFGSAIQVYGTGDGVTIVGNTIGLNANGEPVLGSVTGIAAFDYYTGPVQRVTIGGTGPGQVNEIAGHLLWGVSVANTFDNVRITGNSIHDNGDVGIDLIDSGFQRGVSPNDNLDADAGGNGLQNFPELAAVTRAGPMMHIVGSLHSYPSSEFTIEFFASPECDPTGFGEGHTYLGSGSVTTDGAGDALFDVNLAATAPDGWIATATATLEPIGATSEFSACIAVTGDFSPADLNADGVVDLTDLGLLLGDYGCTGIACEGDIDGNGATDLTDLAQLLASFGA